MNILYTAEATARGDGRSGHVDTPDGILDTDMRVPVEMGGAGGAANPEILFAAGYAACFHGSLQLAARMRKIVLHDTSVTARVSIGADTEGAYRLAVALTASLPGIPADQAHELVDAADQICPYSHATRNNLDVAITIA
ncbi:organic hydroperoxide resistance protein [Microbacterium sp. Clip185]|uniref:organic hydroperoxide resistance protein n=1 Tax=Microbacterium sp. Clip185 TaxID=3025663 RepID=UPI002365C0F9|nr:organic hydroperoxide resistance protein [Microbacterium sp. Clip185]WDG19252.1 organic hydroperoxide resistance protein [Microbacterium sp. Clip185]